MILGTTKLEFNTADGTCKVTRNSPLTRGEVTRTIRMTEAQHLRWMNGALIQHALPHLTASEREFLLTGMSDEDWADEFLDPDDED